MQAFHILADVQRYYKEKKLKKNGKKLIIRKLLVNIDYKKNVSKNWIKINGENWLKINIKKSKKYFLKEQL